MGRASKPVRPGFLASNDAFLRSLKLLYETLSLSDRFLLQPLTAHFIGAPPVPELPVSWPFVFFFLFGFLVPMIEFRLKLGSARL